MIFMARTFDPMANKVTSKVFYSLIEGPKTPKELTKVFKTRHQTVSDHVYRLVKIGIVRKGRKEGKNQYYEIDWDAFASEFLDRSFSSKLEVSTALKHIPRKNADILKRMKGNGILRDIATDYLKEYYEISSTDDGEFLPVNFLLSEHRTLHELAGYFCDSIPFIYERLSSSKAQTGETKALLQLLDEWKRSTIPSTTAEKTALEEAINRFRKG